MSPCEHGWPALTPLSGVPSGLGCSGFRAHPLRLTPGVRTPVPPLANSRANDVTSPCLSFLICKVGIMIHLQGLLRALNKIMHEHHLKQCLASLNVTLYYHLSS